MSWYNKENPNIQTEQTTPKKESYVQVASSSPIHVKSSPAATPETNPPARVIDDAKQKALEAKRQAIRQHKDFGMVRRRFYYLEESDILKGFVKGKGNLRDITQWLTDNYDKTAILAAVESKQKQIREAEALARQKASEEKMRIRLEKSEQQKLEMEQKEKLEKEQRLKEEQEIPVLKPHTADDEGDSPIKARGRARLKGLASPTRENDPVVSTKVEIKKPKVSILDKYKFKQKSQLSLDHFRFTQQQQDDTQEAAPKRRKLVRGSTTSNDTTPVENTPAVSSPNPEDLLASGKPRNIDMQIDDLDMLEEKIKQNRKMNKGKKKSSKYDDDDADLEDDDISDDMSEEDDEANFSSGITSIDSQILEFINNASVQDMIEICSLEPAIAEIVISQRPFATIYEIAENDFSNETSTNSRKRKTLGLRIIENTEFSLKGYRAVDSLIKTCSQYGDSIAKQMKQWGVTITGEGEMDMVEIDPVNEAAEVVEINDVSEDEEEDDSIIVTHHKKKGLRYIKHKPTLLADEITLNNYQQVGINWLNLLYHNKLSCILADEMGLGKTCQVISFMAHLKQNVEKKGPHLVIVPASTIENWLREFQKFCPDITVQAYYGSVRDREELRYELRDSDYDVLVTTYTLASGSLSDFKFLKNQNFDIIVYDEGHFLKNSGTERYAKLMRLQAKFRLLLTGTPLQNNLKELVSLLSFMLPNLFNEKKDDLHGLFNQKVGKISSSSGNTSTSSPAPDYNPLLSIQAISKAKTMMTPFVLRRKKEQVLQHLPAKCHEIVRCELTETQRKIYDAKLDHAKSTRAERERRKLLTRKEDLEEAKNNPIPSSSNVLMALRKASLHPLLFRNEYTDEKLEKMSKVIMNEPEYVEANQNYILEDMQVLSDFELNNLCLKFPKTLSSYTLPDEAYLNSGKITELNKLLDNIVHKRKEKVLVFSLFTQVLDILEKNLTLLNYKFVRLDGATSVETRQDIIDQFYEDDTIPVFLLSTKAGGFGINLVAANNVIIFDQSFNPHDDKQAEDRAHRVGQKKEVTIYKLIVNKTIEENILQLAENKLQLDQSISAEGNDTKFEEKTASLFEKLLVG
ncbi:uncharacterized protein CANTADRAFT_88493 [Suhomyces tanzawaensis NRRL Y-17324]|uniref:DNA helicase n=1 Tax=Suhomyces tanzawaensis NRRL Y-17324 TaxID=984487 RepID=A0A1E4SMF4_9ASCO|nr:uncharacterized protein CANTADRAFT_88493 [Suhomyces tanzawaensis NRRL Y-17324]ODV80562.1 hypothetical protein CANTADRAFT_88493 [Suhomyces tanzawaensis NRRL Y-17324]